LVPVAAAGAPAAAASRHGARLHASQLAAATDVARMTVRSASAAPALT
jgi:hypothetical protein